MTSHSKLIPFILIIGIFLILPPGAWAMSDEAQRLYERGQFEYHDNNYEATLEYLNKALMIEPDDLNILQYKGLALSKLSRQQEAIEILVYVYEHDPAGKKDVLLDLANMYSDLKNDEMALKYFSKAIEVYPERSDLFLRRGLAHMNLKNFAQAEADFNRAGSMDPKLKAYVLYHLAMVSYFKEDLDQAVSRLNDALDAKPDDELKDSIESFLDSVKEEKQTRQKRFSASISLLYQYDDNVSNEPLESTGLITTGTASDKADSSYGTNISLTYKLINRRAIELGLSYSYMATRYDTLETNDFQGHTLSVFYSRYLGAFYIRVEAGTSYFLSQNNPKMKANDISPTIVYSANKTNRFEFSGIAQAQELLDDSADMTKFSGKLTYYHDTPFMQGTKVLTFRLSYGAEFDGAKEDTASDYSIYTTSAGFTFPKFYGIETDLGGAFSKTMYSSDNGQFNDRVDKKYEVSFRIGKTFMERLQLMMLWSHTYNDSNQAEPDLYEFRRNTYTLIFTGNF